MARNFQRLVVNALFAGAALSSFAATIGQEDAYALAKEFMSARLGDNTVLVEANPVFTAGKASNPLYYVFNVAGQSGFVIVSAEAAASPILGYSLEGAYPAAGQPDAMRWMMAGVEKELKAAPSLQQSNTLSGNKRIAKAAAQRAAERKTLSTPSWSQEGPFNDKIPGQKLVGCVGTAMASIMKYYQWPAQGTGEFGGVSFDEPYAWDDMRTDNYRSGYTAAEADAVSTLMLHASKSIDTQYAFSGSSAYEVRVPGAMSTYFGYDPGISYKKRAEVATQADWDRIVKDEIDAGRPVLYCGQDVTAGHAFICDGYEGEYLHFNWGWGGSANGFFLSTALNPTVSRTHHYNNLNTIIYNIKPAEDGIANWSPIHITADGNQIGIGSDMTDLASGKAFTVRVGNLKNLSYTDFAGKIAVALCDASGNLKALLCNGTNLNMQSMGYLFNGTMTFKNCALPAGTTVLPTDRVRLMTLANGDSTWLPVAGELPTVNELDPGITEPATFSIQLPVGLAGVSIDGADSVIKGWDYTFKVTPENSAESVVTVKSNGYVLTPNGYNYTIENVREAQNIDVLVQNAADVKEKRSIWIETPGTLSSIISEEESGTIKELALFGAIDSRDFAFMKNSMRLRKLDLSGVYISANGSDQANAIPRDAFRGLGTLTEVILPNSVNRLNNGCFRQCGITSISIPANVKTYEYNVFVGASKLRDIYVGRETAEFINWCVLSGVNVGACTLHVPSERALANYQKAENWNTIANMVVEKAPAASDFLFAVMDDAEVKFDSNTNPGRLAPGTEVEFTAAHIADNDKNMQVFANSTLLKPDANGTFRTTVNTNTIIHFALNNPIPVDPKSYWTLNGKNGSIGLITDAVNVIPGQDFTIRVNALNIPAGFDQFYWAVALTDADGNIKEFISPVVCWTGGAADNHKFNVNCRVNDSEVRPGNQIRLVTSVAKKIWNAVNGVSDDIVDALPALNNVNPVYNISITQKGNATVTGVPETVVRGRDITMQVKPASAAHHIDLSINGEAVVKDSPSVNYSFVAMQDMDIDIKVYDPKAEGEVVYNVNAVYPDYSNTLYKALTADNVRPNVVVTGATYASDLGLAFRQAFAQKTIKKVDLSGLTIVDDPQYTDNKANMIPQNLFYNPSQIGQQIPVLEEIILPNSVTRIADAAFLNCANIKEIRLPESLVPQKVVVGTYASGSPKYGYPIGNGVFKGCTSLTTVYIPGNLTTQSGRAVATHFDPSCTVYGFLENQGNLGFAATEGDMDVVKKITVVVPEQYLNVYRTPYNNYTWGNPWAWWGFNILSEYPVYGVNFDPSRVVADADVDVTKMASFLGDNVALTETTVEGKIRLINPEIPCRVYDNGTLITPEADGSINLTFVNPAKKSEGVGNHKIDVVYAYDLAFNSSSDLFTISEPEVANAAGYNFQTLDNSDAKAPVLKEVPENSTVRFRVGFTAEHQEGLIARVMNDKTELEADEEGYYTVNITNGPRNIDIFAVPTDGATLNAEELAAVNPAEAAAITSIALSGELTEEELAYAVECFSSLETLDLSEYEGTIPEGAFSGMSELSTVVLPEIEEISANMFSGCGSLQSVDIPASVNSIGEGAFQDCQSLETIRLTGVESIGANAFNGCSSLTTITMLSASAAPSGPAQLRRAAASFDSNAFNGVNPNCIIVLDEGVAQPAAKANYLTTSTGMVTETLPDGTVQEREGRIYSANSDIVFTEASPLTIPHAFTLAENATITFEAQVDSKWTGLVVPFAPENEIAKALIYTLPEGGEDLEEAKGIAANTPYVWRSEETSQVNFSATGVHVASTPAQIKVDGKNYSLHATYTATELPADATYLLDSNGDAFEVAGEEETTTSLAPFSVYATTPMAGVNSIEVTLPGNSHDVTSVTDITAEEVNGLSVAREGNTLVITSPEAATVTLFTIDGRAVRQISLEAGRNVIEAPAAGVYVLGNVKISL